MEAVALSAPAFDYAAFFRQQLLEEVAYWQQQTTEPADPERLRQKRSQLLTTLRFALESEAAWPAAQALIVAFSPYMERWGDWGPWVVTVQNALARATSLGDTPAQARLSSSLARLFHLQSRHQAAIAQYRRTLILARLAGDVYNEARACTNLGYLYTERGQWLRAEVLCYHALQRFTELGSDYGRAHTENHFGILYTRKAKWDLARLHLEKACGIWQASDDSFGLMRGNINL
ncbi:MAG TPA: tetratricopeptide repeat protein, partial [Anaerolineae bacterium]|nr:tetratricopeptide repeat protein [Anaerolineae bacterium]